MQFLIFCIGHIFFPVSAGKFFGGFKMKKKSGIETKTNRNGYFFVLPFILVYAAFQFWPILYTLILGFSDLKGLRSDFSFVGLKNFQKLIHDRYFWGSVKNTFIM